jgi:hypothetical protein
MSLINDALKRAKAAQPPASAGPSVQFRPVEPSQQNRWSSRGILAVIAVILLVVAFAGVLITARKLQPSIPAQAHSATSSAHSVEAPPQADVPALAPATTLPTPSASVGQQSPAAPNQSASPSLVQQASVPEAANEAAPVEFVPSQPAPPRLQGIVWTSTHPSAMINGKTVFVGDKFGDGRVTAITKDSATLVASGETNVLTLAQ